MDEDKDVTVNPGATPETIEPADGNIAPVSTITAPSRRRPIKIIIAALIAAIIVVLIGGSVFGYTMWYQSPDKVVHDAILHAIKAKTVSTTGTITYTSDDVKMNITLDSKSAKGNGEFTIAAKVTIDSTGIQQNFNATGAGKVIDDTLYIKLTGVKDIAEDTTLQSGGSIPSYAPSIFEKIEDRWISIKASDYQGISEEISSQQTCFIKLMEKIQSDSSMSSEIADLYRDNQIVIIDEELGMKDIAGKSSLGYKVSLDKEAANAFVGGVEETDFGKEVKNCNEDIDFAEITKDIDQEVASSENAPVTELWVSSIGHEITEIAIYGDTNSKDALNITLQPVFNEGVTVETPENATSLRAVLGEIQQTIIESSSGTRSSSPGSNATVHLQPAI